MTEEKPLTALCAICHAGDQKYTCPRCGIHTCSLPCVRLHKIRASCSGVRDPTAYRKRADLATASSIDSDFNFITTLERSLWKADEARDGIRFSRGVHDSLRLENLVKERNITWRRAPKGMKRRQENSTRIEHGTITWTVEFMLGDGTRRLTAVPETQTMGEAWSGLLKPSKSTRKRRRSQNEDEGKVAKKQMVSECDASANDAPITSLPEDFEQFYLLRPNTPSKLKVLRPIATMEKLLDVLPNRTIMEYPTIHVKHETPEELALPFMTEEKYLADFGEDIIIPPEPTVLEEGEIHEEENVGSLLHAFEDPSKVLSVLQADLQPST